MMLKALLFPAVLAAMMPLQHEGEITPLPTVPAQGESDQTGTPSCGGALAQGGLIICHGVTGTKFQLGDTVLTTDASGSVSFGLGRKASSPIVINATDMQLNTYSFSLDVAARNDETATLRGIDCDKIDARTAEQKAHAGRSWVKKQDGWQTFHDGRGGLDGFLRPAEGPVSSPFGYVRRYVTEGCPTKERPHFGYDIAAVTGTPIIAPAAGVVTLAETDLYYEGGTVFLDHGQGLVSLFLHMSELEVNVGDVLEAGDQIGKIGATGRVTGAHLHWAVKWRNTSRSDRDGDFYIDPALLLDLPRQTD